MDGGGCSAGLRVWSGRPQFEAVLHGGVSVQRCRCGQGTTVGAWGPFSAGLRVLLRELSLIHI